MNKVQYVMEILPHSHTLLPIQDDQMLKGLFLSSLLTELQMGPAVCSRDLPFINTFAMLQDFEGSVHGYVM